MENIWIMTSEDRDKILKKVDELTDVLTIISDIHASPYKYKKQEIIDLCFEASVQARLKKRELRGLFRNRSEEGFTISGEYLE